MHTKYCVCIAGDGATGQRTQWWLLPYQSLCAMQQPLTEPTLRSSLLIRWMTISSRKMEFHTQRSGHLTRSEEETINQTGFVFTELPVLRVTSCTTAGSMETLNLSLKLMVGV